MRSLIATLVLGVGALGASAVLPQQAQANGPWHGHYYRGHYARYYGPGVTFVPPVVNTVVVPPAVVPAPIVEPVIVAPAVAPYASFSFGYRQPWYGHYRGDYYHYHR